MQQDVFIAISTDNPGSTTPIGSGTATDPYRGPSDSGTWFDYTMANLLGSDPVTVRLGPGVFRTGADGAGHQGWAARDAMQIIGSSISATTLKLVGTTGQQRWAIGMPGGSTGLMGSEASDFLIDCGFPSSSPPANTGNGAISVSGTHVYLRRIKAINFGSTYGLTLIVFSAAAADSEDCIISECYAQNTRDDSLSSQTVVLFGSSNTSGNPHRFCVIRDCFALGAAYASPPPTVSKCLGIQPGLGLGTIVENNVVANLKWAVYARPCPTKDLVIRDNIFYNVSAALHWDQTGASIPVGRISVLGNLNDLSRVGASAPKGLDFLVGPYDTLVARRNIVRQIPDSDHSLRPDAIGISVVQCTNAFIDDNVINDTVNTRPKTSAFKAWSWFG